MTDENIEAASEKRNEAMMAFSEGEHQIEDICDVKIPHIIASVVLLLNFEEFFNSFKKISQQNRSITS